MAFGWGAGLNHREREALKERIALIAGLTIAAIVVIALGLGFYQDNVAHPAAVRAENNRPVAQVGSDTIRLGFFTQYEKFQANQTSSQLTQVQQELTQLQTTPQSSAKNAAVIAQLQAQQSQLQQSQASLASQSLNALIESQVVLQRSHTAGVSDSSKVQAKAMLDLEKQAGGPIHLQTFIKQSGLSRSEMSDLITAQTLRTQIEKKLAAGVGHVQTKVRASHILLPPSKHAEAKKVLRQALRGANFAALARKYSTDTGSAKKGGDLGYFAHGAMVAPFDKAAFSMKVGQIKLVQSQYGWHIIKVTGRERAHLSNTEYQQARQGAFTSWLTTQQQLMHVQRFISPNKLPNPVPATSTLGGLPGQQPGQVPGQVQGQLPPGSHVPVVKGQSGLPGQSHGQAKPHAKK